jgi:peptidylprolyl isomerase
MKNLAIAFLLTISFSLFAEPPTQDVKKISEAMGYLIGKNLDDLGINLDVDLVMKGIAEASKGKTSPMTEEECVSAISIMQDAIVQQTAQKNLEEANRFLQENAKKAQVHELSSGKLQYRIEKKGSGSKVEKYHCPMVRYTGKYLDGTTFGSSEEPEIISLDATIPGFANGLVGMQEGEKRTLFIHPELGYQNTGVLLPNSLLIFEVEVLKADASLEGKTSLKKLAKEFSNDTDALRQ